MSILTNMLSRVGKSEQDFKSNTKMGKIFRRRGVTRSKELDRVVNLPRRQWEDSQSIHAELTDWLKKPRGTMTLRPVQAAALSDLHDFGGLLAPIRVGGGKTAVSLLASEVIGAKRPLLIIPAKLRRKTEIEMVRYLQHWRFQPPKIVTYEWLGRVQADDEKDEDGELTKSGFLRRYRPDLIVMDECHKTKNKSAAITRRLTRYMNEFNPKCVAMSGTITKRSIKDYAHIAEWCLNRIAPVPLTYPVLSEWADALDEKVRPEARLAPGALLLLCNQDEITEIQKDSLGSLRKAYRRRLVETPGVIATSETFVDCSLVISAVEPEMSPVTDSAFEHMNMNWETPDGCPIPDAVSFWRHAREIICGFHYTWWNQEGFTKCVTEHLQHLNNVRGRQNEKESEEQEVWCAPQHLNNSQGVQKKLKSIEEKILNRSAPTTEKSIEGETEKKSENTVMSTEQKILSGTVGMQRKKEEKILKNNVHMTKSIEQKILSVCALATERDTALVKAVSILNGGMSTPELGTSKIGTAVSPLNSLKNWSRSTMGTATFAESAKVWKGEEEEKDEDISRLITIIRQDASEEFSVSSATERLECWMTVLKVLPALLPIFKEAIEAARAPYDWLAARKEWCAAVREIIKRKDLDSELQVANAIVQGRVDDPESQRMDVTGNFIGGTVYANWIAIKDTFKPNTVPVWIDDSTLKYCANWMKTHNGIVWVEHVVFGERLAEMTGRPFFHRKGEDKQRRLIDETSPKDGPIIASIASNSEGRNLQAWSENLIASPPPTGSVFEQLLGRCHRDGQMADEVSFDVILACIQQWSGFQQALADAKYIQDSTGQLQKLVYADVDVPGPAEVAMRSGARWS